MFFFVFNNKMWVYITHGQNEEVFRRNGMGKELASRADQRVLQWFGHRKRMDEQCMAKMVMRLTVSGQQLQGRPRYGYVLKILGQQFIDQNWHQCSGQPLLPEL